MCLVFAATYPDRTSALILHGAFARIMQAPDQPFGFRPERVAALVAAAADRWGTGDTLTSFFPSAATDPAMRETLARYERNGASPGAMADFVAMASKIDVRHVLPTIQVPTIVIHSTGDPVVDVKHGRYLAEHIPSARYIELPGADHLTVRQSDLFPFEDIEEFLTGHRPAPELERVLKTVLFTDIVSSTKRAVELGDQRWKQVLDDHDAVMRGLLDHYRGTEIDTTGDGFLAAFEGPARAVRCAVAATRAVRPLGLEMRAGVHTGECVQRGTNLGGISVHIGARVAALAGAGQVLVSRTVTDLVAGSGLRFADEGEHRLKGVPEPWQLFSVATA
jgi:class 3 adenylate cyclase